MAMAEDGKHGHRGFLMVMSITNEPNPIPIDRDHCGSWYALLVCLTMPLLLIVTMGNLVWLRMG